MDTPTYKETECKTRPPCVRGYVEGLPVDMVLDHVYRSVRDQADRRGLTLQCEVIAWDPLIVAADQNMLTAAICLVAEYVIERTEEGAVLLQAFPSHDDIYVRFEVRNERPARRHSDRSFDADQILRSARGKLESIGGQMASYCTDRGGARVSFWLPQWVQ